MEVPTPLLQGSTDLDHIQIIKKVGGKLTDSYLDEGEENTFLGNFFFMRPRFHLGQIDWSKLSKEVRECQNPHR